MIDLNLYCPGLEEKIRLKQLINRVDVACDHDNARSHKSLMI